MRIKAFSYHRNWRIGTRSPAVAEIGYRTEYDALINDHVDNTFAATYKQNGHMLKKAIYDE